MTPPSIIEGCEPDPRSCVNCGEIRESGRPCPNCRYQTGVFTAALTPVPRKERRINTALRFIFDRMFKTGALKRSK